MTVLADYLCELHVDENDAFKLDVSENTESLRPTQDTPRTGRNSSSLSSVKPNNNASITKHYVKNKHMILYNKWNCLVLSIVSPSSSITCVCN